MPAEQLHLGCPVVSVGDPREVSPEPENSKINGTAMNDVELVYRKPNGEEVKEHFDHVILATHSDTALSICRNGGGVTAEEEEVLGRFKWSENECILHYDEQVRACMTPYISDALYSL